MSQPELICAGHVTLDRYGEKNHPGGSVTYAALAFSALGRRVALLSRAGDDFPKNFFPAEVATQIHPASTTTIFENRYDCQGRRRQYLFSCAEALSSVQLPPAWRSPRALFLAPVMGEIHPDDWLSTCRAELVAAGLQGFLREAKEREVLPKFFDVNADWLQGVDLVFLSDDDCQAQPELPARLRSRVKTVILTHQHRGCTVYEGGRDFFLGVYPTKEIDPTGAGDTFAAGFLHALLRGSGIEDAARLGAACASIIIEGTATSQAWRIAREARTRALQIKG